jgi:phage terminase large subunit-like protein
MLFPNEDETFQALWRFWLPEEALVKRGPMAPTLEEWARAGFVTILPGEVIDLRTVGEQILKDCETFNCLSLGFDKFHAHSVISELMEQGIEMADVGQTFRHMNAPCKELERLLMQQRLNHGGNPVARWMAGNAVAEMNQDDNIRPSRKKSSDKIDGLVALLMAIERTLTAEEESFVMYVAGEEAD